MKILIFRIKCLMSVPFYLWFRFKDYDFMKREIWYWKQICPVVQFRNHFLQFIWIFAAFPEYRTLFLFRMGGILDSIPIPRLNSLYIISRRNVIGCGLVFYHGFSTILFPESMGEGCTVSQNVTIGRAKEYGPRPKIGNNVKICAGAIVLGDITIGDNVTIGAGCVVVKSVPSDCVVVGNPAYIVRKNGIKVHEAL